MFDYEIRDGEAYIFAINDILITSVEIPKIINDHPVGYISQFTFEYCFNLEYINGVKLKEGVNIINNKYIFIINDEMVKCHQTMFNRMFHTILFSIGDDYIYESCINGECIINGLEYNGKFNPRFKI